MVPGRLPDIDLPGGGIRVLRCVAPPGRLKPAGRAAVTSPTGPRAGPAATPPPGPPAGWASGPPPTSPFPRLGVRPRLPRRCARSDSTKACEPQSLYPPLGTLWWGARRERQGAGPQASRGRTECPGGSTTRPPGTPSFWEPPEGVWVKVSGLETLLAAATWGDLEEAGCWG